MKRFLLSQTKKCDWAQAERADPDDTHTGTTQQQQQVQNQSSLFRRQREQKFKVAQKFHRALCCHTCTLHTGSSTRCVVTSSMFILRCLCTNELPSLHSSQWHYHHSPNQQELDFFGLTIAPIDDGVAKFKYKITSVIYHDPVIFSARLIKRCIFLMLDKVIRCYMRLRFGFLGDGETWPLNAWSCDFDHVLRNIFVTFFATTNIW